MQPLSWVTLKLIVIFQTGIQPNVLYTPVVANIWGPYHLICVIELLGQSWHEQKHFSAPSELPHFHSGTNVKVQHNQNCGQWVKGCVCREGKSLHAIFTMVDLPQYLPCLRYRCTLVYHSTYCTLVTMGLLVWLISNSIPNKLWRLL